MQTAPALTSPQGTLDSTRYLLTLLHYTVFHSSSQFPILCRLQPSHSPPSKPPPNQMSNNRVPINYHVPPFPSLYEVFPTGHNTAHYLYYMQDIWRFTLYWTLIFYAATHLTVAACAMVMQSRNWKVAWIVPLFYAVIGSLEALITGSIIGLMYVSFTYRCTWCQCSG